MDGIKFDKLQEEADNRERDIAEGWTPEVTEVQKDSQDDFTRKEFIFNLEREIQLSRESGNFIPDIVDEIIIKLEKQYDRKQI